MKLLLHAHTTYSHDGRLTPKELASLAKRKGFDAVLISDHFEDLNEHSFQDLVDECKSIPTCMLIPGYERDWGGFHLCAFGIERWIDDDRIETWSTRVRENGGIVSLAHPARYRHEVPQDVLEACDAVEIWNSKRPYDGLMGPHPEAYRLVGQRLALVGQDLHRARDATRLGIEVGRSSTAREIMDAIRHGDYRSTSWAFARLKPPSPLVMGVLRAWHPLRRWMWVPPVHTFRALRRFGKTVSSKS